MMFGDDLITCPRCKGQDALQDQVCWTCQQELIAGWDGALSWRAAWEREKQETLRYNLERIPGYAQDVLRNFDLFIQQYTEEPDPDFVAALNSGRAEFVARLESIYQKHPQLRPKENQ